MSVRYRPYRRLRNDLFSLVLVLAVPCVLILVFPLASLQALPSLPHPLPSASACSFVTLSPEQERKALAAARTAWQLDRKAMRQMHIDLYAAALPVFPRRPVLNISSRARINRTKPEPYAPDLLPPTLAAPPPVKIAPQPDADKVEPAFSREELLKLN